MTATMMISTADVSRTLARHLRFYRGKRPTYQTVMLNDLLAVWQQHHAHVLDVGGGTGVIGQCIADLLPAGSVTAVDVEDRFCPDLTIATQVYDGAAMPFAASAFAAATINNVVHHVPAQRRLPLFREIARVVDGPLYIKDHVAGGPLDHVRLTILDLLGNLPFSGMLKASYLSRAEWRALAEASGYRIAAEREGRYRRGLFALLFPNRLEITMRWERR
ncbi:class I SAM-dependent methyltransferase [Allosphingosinicella deserti]|uniref:Methyltransferase domain-containing protein n=1 Tax=Allosphingosinicella deserti TaxID=2116704 RepID=A0A2P7QUP2_9SPHN|nr:class I SAM-dependent methyltransferase [Sphingomonas deserti]PSJ41672.1 hypothetical protein C7I55_05065 [Sphingomonas deserti]